jgi:hypothetical protein
MHFTFLTNSHGSVLEDGKTAIKDYIAHRLAREAQIFQVLGSDVQRAWTPMEIVAILYKGKSKIKDLKKRLP